jgi:hypothetical protein
MRVNFAHVQHPNQSGGSINFAVFDARSSSGAQSDNARLLAQLTMGARANRLRVDQSALAFMENGRLQFYGDKHLVDFLSHNGLPQWTNYLDA